MGITWLLQSDPSCNRRICRGLSAADNKDLDENQGEMTHHDRPLDSNPDASAK
jgi:hypothetical protein